MSSESDYLRLMQLNKHIDELLKKRLKEISKIIIMIKKIS